MAAESFAETLVKLTVPGELCRAAGDAAGGERPLQGLACAHRCRIVEGAHGICRVRLNRGGQLLVPHGYVSSVACDPPLRGSRSTTSSRAATPSASACSAATSAARSARTGTSPTRCGIRRPWCRRGAPVIIKTGELSGDSSAKHCESPPPGLDPASLD